MRRKNIVLILMMTISLFLRYADVYCTQKTISLIHNDAQLENILAQGKPVVIKFYMERCPACVAYKNVFEQITQEFNNDVVFLDVPSSARSLIQKYRVSGYPTTIIITKTGLQIFNKTGIISYDELRKAIQQTL